MFLLSHFQKQKCCKVILTPKPLFVLTVFIVMKLDGTSKNHSNKCLVHHPKDRKLIKFVYSSSQRLLPRNYISFINNHSVVCTGSISHRTISGFFSWQGSIELSPDECETEQLINRSCEKIPRPKGNRYQRERALQRRRCNLHESG